MSFQAKELIFYALDNFTIWPKTGVGWEGGGLKYLQYKPLLSGTSIQRC